MSAVDWSRSRLGPLAAWPQSLRTSVDICLSSRFPMVVMWGRDYVLLYNDAYRPILGAKHPAAIGVPILETWSEIAHIIGPMLDGVMREGRATWSADQLLPLERNGYLEECTFTFSYSPIRDESGSVGGIFTAVTETTERVQAERRLATLRELADAASRVKSAEEAWSAAVSTLEHAAADVPFALLYEVDEQGRTARLTGAAGLAPGGPASPTSVDLGGRETGGPWPLPQVARSGRAEHVTGLEERALPGGGWETPPREALVMRVARPGSEQTWALLVLGASPRRALDERYRSFFQLVAEHVGTALANGHAFEEERRRAEALAEVDRAKTAFFSNVSHEFRTPLTLLLGPTEDLLAGAAGPLAPGQHDRLRLVHRNATRLLKLVNTLLDFSRLEAGRLAASFRPVDLASLTADLASSFRSAMERAGLKLEVDCPPLPEPLHVDPEMWEKVVLNLLSNALKFTFSGCVSVRLRWTGAGAALEVADTGVGIPENELQSLFRRFHRVAGTRARTHEGSGIGLALVAELAKMHGGTVEVSSAFGLGSTFTVKIPAGTAHLPEERLAPTETSAPGALAAAFVEEAGRWTPETAAPPRAERREESARVLVVDDNADMRDYLVRLLGEHWEVEGVPDGTNALKRALAQVPDLVLADVMMPGLDGFALLRALRSAEATRRVPVVLLSARAGEEARVEGFDAGADDYLLKPFSQRELVARVRTHLQLARLRAQAEAERARLYGLFESAPALVCILRGPEHRFELANAAYRRLVDRPVVGRTVREAFPDVEGQGYFELLDEIYRGGETFVGKERCLRLANAGGDVYVTFVYQATRGADGAVDGVAVFGFDVTDLVHARESARSALESRDQFLAAASHELRDPVHALQLHLRNALSRAPGEGAAGLRRAFALAARLARLVDSLFDLERIRTGRVTLKPEELDLHDVVSEVLARFDEEAGERRVAIRREGSTRGSWDRRRLDQVVSALLAPAFARGKGGAVELRVGNEGEDAVLEVRDPGTALAAGSEPPGLSLEIARQLVDALGGRLSIATAPGGGALFSVRLPREIANL